MNVKGLRSVPVLIHKSVNLSDDVLLGLEADSGEQVKAGGQVEWEGPPVGVDLEEESGVSNLFSQDDKYSDKDGVDSVVDSQDGIQGPLVLVEEKVYSNC